MSYISFGLAMRRWLLPMVGLSCLLGLVSCTMLGSDGHRWVWSAHDAAEVFVKADNLVEGAAIGSPDVTIDGSRFLMAYAQGGSDTKGRIGLAESVDGSSWRRLNGGESILQPGPAGAWDAWFLDTPCMVKVGTVWYLFYFGADSNKIPGACLGLATSTDGITFTKDPANPVLRPGAGDAWDGLWVESPSVRWDGQAFQMMYTGVDANWRIRIGHASSADGRSWVKDPANPVLDIGPAGAWDDYAAAVPSLVQAGDGTWEMYYCAQSAAETALGLRVPKIGRALSRDLSHWTRDAGNPLIGQSLTWYRPNGPWTPSAVFDARSQRYLLWYETGTGFGLVTASRTD